MVALCIVGDLCSGELLEAEFRDAWAGVHGAEVEVRLEGGVRADAVTETHAVEVDFARKWAEAIGQSALYARLTGLRPGIVLIVRDDGEWRFVRRLEAALAQLGAEVSIWVVCPDGDPGGELLECASDAGGAGSGR